jgi:hypothetical protein
MNTGGSLVAVLSDPICLLVKDVGDGDIYVGARKFVDSGLGVSIGFYDWLRGSDGQIVGARTWFLSNSGVEKFHARLASNSAIEWDEGNFMLFFSAKRKFVAHKSDDQEFGVHRLAISSDGLLLLTYDVKLLSPDELSGIKRFANSGPS